MMCPNKSHPDWKEMVEKYGKIEAFRHWLKGNYSVSDAERSDQSKIAEVPIKEGVSELFDSNPELANQVYEALLGENIKIGNGRIDTEIGPDSHMYKILDNKNNVIGEIGVSYPDYVKEGVLPNASDFESNKVFISQVYLENEFKGKGLGKQAYLKFLLNLQQRGFEISSGINTSEFANRVWESLVKNNYADKTTDGYTFNNNFKQQAQQQYSQYLDTIFPDSKVKDIVYHITYADENNKLPFDKFDIKLSSTDGIYFLADKNDRSGIGDVRGRPFPFIINITNPDITPEVDINVKKSRYEGDGVIIKPSYLKGKNSWYVVFEPEQIHILGSQKDIEGFKEFVGEPKTEKKVDNTIFKPTPVEVQKQRPSTENVMREFTGRSIDEIFEQHKEALEQAGITLDQLKHSATKNNLSNEEIEQWLQTCLGSSKKGSSNIRPPMAKQGMKDSKFTRGGTWRLVKDLQGYPTHENGGVDLMIGKDGVNITSGQSTFKAEYGLILPKAQQGINLNFGRYKRFKNSLPNNLKNTPESEYAMRYYWKHSNKPKDFYEIQNWDRNKSYEENYKNDIELLESGNFPYNQRGFGLVKEDDGSYKYHGFSVEPNTLRFLKPKNHPSLQKELDWYYSDTPESNDFRSKYDLDKSGEFYRYVPKK